MKSVVQMGAPARCFEPEQAQVLRQSRQCQQTKQGQFFDTRALLSATGCSDGNISLFLVFFNETCSCARVELGILYLAEWNDMQQFRADFMMLKLFAFSTAFALPLFAGAVPARAQFAVCNQSFDVVNVAIGQLNREVFRTRGWWKIGPNQCANVIRDPLETRYIYVYAKDVFGKELLQGSVSMCVAPNRFIIEEETDCLIRGYLDAPFIEVDTQDTERWTLFITARPE